MYLAPDLPSGQMLYVRIWAHVAGTWRFTDATFTADPPAPLLSQVTYPRHGAANAYLPQPIQWTAVPSAELYRLWVGTAPGAHDLLDTGDVQETSAVADSLPSATWLYARLWTRAGGVWRYTDSSFSVRPLVTRVSYPPDGATNADLRLPIQWMPLMAVDVRAYRLFLGTAPGATDLLDTNSTSQTKWLTPGIPAGQVIHARLWTQVGPEWRYTDSSFTAVAPTANDSIMTFDAFANIFGPGLPITSHTESGFTVSTFEGNWRGHVSAITFPSPAGQVRAGQVRVIAADGGTFRFNSVDLYSSTTPIPYTITGFRDDVPVFTITGTVPRTQGHFKTVVNPNGTTEVDAVIIGLTNRTGCCGNSMGLDNISVSR
jgi:hypothetical protein